ncbi:MAG TPA: aldo/keto reductase, partial [Niabella sp.]|nr:aldo/keto reductase [Niabella sp.]
DFFNYVQLNRENPNHQKYYQWRDKYFTLCQEFSIDPPAAAISFGLRVPGITSIALNSSNPQRVQKNIEMANTTIPNTFWQRMKSEQLIDPSYPHI